MLLLLVSKLCVWLQMSMSGFTVDWHHQVQWNCFWWTWLEIKVTLLHCTKFYFGQYSWLFLDFTTKISRRFKFFLNVLLLTVFMFLFFLTPLAGLAVTLLLFTTSNRLSTVICFVSTDKSSKKRKTHGAGKTKKDNIGQILFCLTMLCIQKNCLKSMELLWFTPG